MRFLKYLTEKWAGSFKPPARAGGIAEVFVNPTRAEYKDALEASKGKAMMHPPSARAFYDPSSDKIWIWRGDVLHDSVLRSRSEIPSKSLKFILEPITKRLFLYGDANLSRLAGEKGMKAIEEVENKARKKIKTFAPESSSWKLVSM